MKCTILNGSPRENGHTTSACEQFAESIGMETTILSVQGLNLKHCTGCNRCRDSTCPLPDWKTIEQSLDCDLLVFATPLRFNGVSSQMKTFIDRMNPYWWYKTKNRKACGIICAGSKNPNFEHALSEIKAAQNGTGFEWIGELTIQGTDDGDVQETVAKQKSFGIKICKRS